MKKTSLLVLIAAMVLSCGKSYKAQEVELTNRNDSISYAYGVFYGKQIKDVMLKNASEKEVDKATTDFIESLQNAWNSEAEVTEAEEIRLGKEIANTVAQMEVRGLQGNPNWQMNENVLFQALVNGLYGQENVMGLADAQDLLNRCMMFTQPDPELEPEPAKKAQCPKNAKEIQLESFNDSINYATGFCWGDQLGRFMLANDSTGEKKETFIATLNDVMKHDFPGLFVMGEQMGKAMKEQDKQGYFLGQKTIQVNFDVLTQALVNGIKEFGEMDQDSAKTYLDATFQQLQEEAMQAYREEQKAQAEAQRAESADYIAENVKFLEENKEKKGVITTESGLQYQVLRQGKGAKPAATDRVKVHYTGTLIDGTVFDSSVERGEPITFPLNGVIAGWTEGVQLMSVGSKFRFFIPEELGYGERNMGNIPPFSTLIFDVELLDIEK